MLYDPAKMNAFKTTLLEVVGPALEAAHYQLATDPMFEARGLFRFQKSLPQLGENAQGRIDWQLLAFQQDPFARFRINLARLDAGQHTADYTLSGVIWHVFEARVLPSDDYWWPFRTGDELPHAIAHAGKLLFGYGVPWLEMHDDVPTSK